MAKKISKILLPIVFGGTILWWMYRDFDFNRIIDTLIHGMNWWWMALSLVFGITAQLFRGLRWKQTLSPLGENPRTSTLIHAIFLSYTSSLIIPRSGEVVRCGVLTRYDGTSLTKSLGTVVTERIIDSLLILLIAAIVFAFQLHTFLDFFSNTGTNFSMWLHTFTLTGWIVTILCGCIILFLAIIFICKFRSSKTITDLKAGIFSLKEVENKWLFAFYTFAIWASYFLHFYIAFFCFDYTVNLGIMAALVAFIIGSFAVIVPTPNGMGPWHFAVKTILLLYGVATTHAETFVLIVWAVQTALIPLLGVFSLLTIKKKY